MHFKGAPLKCVVFVFMLVLCSKNVLKYSYLLGTGLFYIRPLHLLVQVLTNVCLLDPSVSYRSLLKSILLVILLSFSLFSEIINFFILHQI